MIAVKSVTLVWAEGRTEEYYRRLLPKTFSSFEAANRWLRWMAAEAPDDGSYNKTDFKIEWKDGQVYEGRYDLKRHDAGLPDLLQRHVRNFASYYSGRWRPPHIPPEHFERFIDGIEKSNPGTRAYYGRVLDEYDLKGEHT